MPVNCSADVEAVITHIDQVFSGRDQKAINEIKDMFGLTVMTHLDDVAGACKCELLRFVNAISDELLSLPLVRNNLWDWQSLQPTSGPNTTFTRFCDALEVKDGVSAPSSGWGVAHALPAWGAFWRSGYLRQCENTNNIWVDVY